MQKSTDLINVGPAESKPQHFAQPQNQQQEVRPQLFRTDSRNQESFPTQQIRQSPPQFQSGGPVTRLQNQHRPDLQNFPRNPHPGSVPAQFQVRPQVSVNRPSGPNSFAPSQGSLPQSNQEGFQNQSFQQRGLPPRPQHAPFANSQSFSSQRPPNLQFGPRQQSVSGGPLTPEGAKHPSYVQQGFNANVQPNRQFSQEVLRPGNPNIQNHNQVARQPSQGTLKFPEGSNYNQNKTLENAVTRQSSQGSLKSQDHQSIAGNFEIRRPLEQHISRQSSQGSLKGQEPLTKANYPDQTRVAQISTLGSRQPSQEIKTTPGVPRQQNSQNIAQPSQVSLKENLSKHENLTTALANQLSDNHKNASLNTQNLKNTANTNQTIRSAGIQNKMEDQSRNSAVNLNNLVSNSEKKSDIFGSSMTGSIYDNSSRKVDEDDVVTSQSKTISQPLKQTDNHSYDKTKQNDTVPKVNELSDKKLETSTGPVQQQILFNDVSKNNKHNDSSMKSINGVEQNNASSKQKVQVDTPETIQKEPNKTSNAELNQHQSASKNEAKNQDNSVYCAEQNTPKDTAGNKQNDSQKSPIQKDSKTLTPKKEANEANTHRTKLKDGDNDSGVDESTQGNDRSPSTPNKKSPSKIPSAKQSNGGTGTNTPRLSLSRSSSKSAYTAKTPETPTPSDKKKVPMNKIQVGNAPSPNIKTVKSKIGSLENATYKPSGGKVKIESKKLDFNNVTPRIAAKNDTYAPSGGTKKIVQTKLQWNAKSKIGSLDNTAHKPGGGDKKIETVKLDFKDKAKPKVASTVNITHKPGGGTVKIESQKLEIKAQSKIGSLDNVKHKPGGGTVKIFDDKDYIKQISDHGNISGTQELESLQDLSTYLKERPLSRCGSRRHPRHRSPKLKKHYNSRDDDYDSMVTRNNQRNSDYDDQRQTDSSKPRSARSRSKGDKESRNRYPLRSARKIDINDRPPFSVY